MANMNNFDDKNLFDDDFDLLSESADSLFGAPAQQNVQNKENKLAENALNDKENTPKTAETKEKIDKNQAKNNKKIEKNSKNKQKNKKENKIKQEKNEEINSEITQDNNKDVVGQKEIKQKQEDFTNKLETKNSQTSSSENKKEKTKNQKKPLGKKSIIAIVACVLVLVVAGVLLGLYLKDINTKLATPQITILQRQSGTIINIEKVSNATSYEIVVLKEEQTIATFTSLNNVVEIKSFLNQAGPFSIKVRALGKTEKANSDFCEQKDIVCMVTLQTPNVFLNDKVISWNPVENATSYKVYYRASAEADEVEYIEIEQNTSLLTFDLTQLNNFGAGLYPVCVQAISNGEYFLNSKISDVINYENIVDLQAPSSAVYNNTNKTLTFVVLNNVAKPATVQVVVRLKGQYSLLNYTIQTADLSFENVLYEGKEAIKFTASFSEIILDEVESLTLTSVKSDNYENNSTTVEASIEY